MTAARRPSSAAVRVEGLRKSFGRVDALTGVDLVVEPGTVLGLLGPNGAGKTTTVRILATLTEPDGGHAEVAGYDVVRDAAALRRVIGLAGQFAAVDESLTGRENIELVGRLYHLGGREARRRATDLLERFGLTDAGDRQVGTYSGGMRRRLDLGASLVGHPAVLFLDEPTTGLDPQSRLGLWETIRQLVADGTTLLLTTQYLEEADHLADRIAVIDDGRVIADGTPDELKSRLGGDVVELTVTAGTDVEEAARSLVAISTGAPTVDAEAHSLVVPVATGSGALIDVVRRLDAAGIGIAELALRRPSLDEVFLALTGDRSAAPPSPPDTPAGLGGGDRHEAVRA